jgi:hypothetical protein
MKRALMLAYTVAALGACGGSGSEGPGGASNTPTPHALFTNKSEMIAAGQAFEGTFSLPVAATVSYTLTNRSTTSPDHWDVSIVDSSELSFFENGQPYQSVSPLHQNVSTISDSGPLPAGDYAIALICDNLVENCQFSLDATATF